MYRQLFTIIFALMDKEKIERQLKAELVLIQIYSFFVIGLIAGISSIVITKTYTDKFVLYLLWVGGFSFIVTLIAFARSYIRIYKFTKH